MATTKKTEAPAEITPPDVKSMNVWEKLLLARLDVLQSGMKKTGKHLSPNYKYFTLEDINNVTTPICVKYRILVHHTFTDTTGMATVINVDNPTETIPFTCPIEKLVGIENKMGERTTNVMQDLGSMQTYARRYLDLLVFDIVEYDSIDGGDEQTDDGVKLSETRKIPPTATERAEIVQSITDPNGQAAPEQFEALRQGCSIWRNLDASCDEQIQKIALQTKGFTEGTKDMVENLLVYIAQSIKVLQDKEAAQPVTEES